MRGAVLLFLLRPTLWLLIAVTLVMPPGGNKVFWQYQGRLEAERDLAAGKLCLRTYGYPADPTGKLEKLVQKKMGIQLHVVAGCVVTDELVECSSGYNERMMQEIDRRFGPGVLDKLHKEVVKENAKRE